MIGSVEFKVILTLLNLKLLLLLLLLNSLPIDERVGRSEIPAVLPEMPSPA